VIVFGHNRIRLAKRSYCTHMYSHGFKPRGEPGHTYGYCTYFPPPQGGKTQSTLAAHSVLRMSDRDTRERSRAGTTRQRVRRVREQVLQLDVPTVGLK